MMPNKRADSSGQKGLRLKRLERDSEMIGLLNSVAAVAEAGIESAGDEQGWRSGAEMRGAGIDTKRYSCVDREPEAS